MYFFNRLLATLVGIWNWTFQILVQYFTCNTHLVDSDPDFKDIHPDIPGGNRLAKHGASEVSCKYKELVM